MPAIVFHGWYKASHPYRGRVSGEQPWNPGRYEIESADEAMMLVRAHENSGPDLGPAFTIIEEPAPTAPPAPTNRKAR